MINPIDFIILLFLTSIFLFLNYKAYKILWKIIYIYSKVFVIIVIILVLYKYAIIHIIPIINEIDITTGGYISYFIETSLLIQKFYEILYKEENNIVIQQIQKQITFTNNQTAENHIPSIFYLIESIQNFIESLS